MINMEKFEKEACKRYFAGLDKTHIAVYPVLVVNSFCNGKKIDVPYKINIKTAFTDNGENWRWNQLFTGEDENMPLCDWNDVIIYTEKEVKRIGSLLEPLFNDDKLTCWNRWHEINKTEVIITGIPEIKEEEDEEEDYFERLIHKNNKFESDTLNINFMTLDDHEISQRTKIEHWMPIYIAWKTFHERIMEDYLNGILIEKF